VRGAGGEKAGARRDWRRTSDARLLQEPCRDGSEPALSEVEGTRPGRAKLDRSIFYFAATERSLRIVSTAAIAVSNSSSLV